MTTLNRRTQNKIKKKKKEIVPMFGTTKHINVSSLYKLIINQCPDLS